MKNLKTIIFQIGYMADEFHISGLRNSAFTFGGTVTGILGLV